VNIRRGSCFQTVFEQMLFGTAEPPGERKKFRFKDRLTSLDGSTVDLSARLFDWSKDRRTRGAIEPHLLLDHDGYVNSLIRVLDFCASPTIEQFVSIWTN